MAGARNERRFTQSSAVETFPTGRVLRRNLDSELWAEGGCVNETTEFDWQASPAEILTAIRCYRESRSRLGEAFVRVEHSLALHRSNPALWFMLVHSDRMLGVPSSERFAFAQRMILRKQHEIVTEFHFPRAASKACARILGRMSPNEIRLCRLVRLQELLCDGELLQLFSHAASVDANLIGFVWDARRLLDLNLLTRLAHRLESTDLLSARILVHRIRLMMQSAQISWPPVEKICGIGALEQQYCDLARLCERPSLFRRRGLHATPLPEWPDIELLESAQEILIEGEEMQHCAATYLSEVLTGDPPTLLYRITWPERATLQLVRLGTTWHIAELRCRRNRKPSLATFAYINQWLREMQHVVDQPSAKLEIPPESCPF